MHAPDGKTQVPTIRLTNKQSCAGCGNRTNCLPAGLGADAVPLLEGFVSSSRRLRQGETLYAEGGRFRSLFAVRAGTFKSVVLSPGGTEQVTGSHFAGDVMGLDGVAHGAHETAATALEDAEICVIPYARVSATTEGSFKVLQLVARIMSREIVR